MQFRRRKLWNHDEKMVIESSRDSHIAQRTLFPCQIIIMLHMIMESRGETGAKKEKCRRFSPPQGCINYLKINISVLRSIPPRFALKEEIKRPWFGSNLSAMAVSFVSLPRSGIFSPCLPPHSLACIFKYFKTPSHAPTAEIDCTTFYIPSEPFDREMLNVIIALLTERRDKVAFEYVSTAR